MTVLTVTGQVTDGGVVQPSLNIALIDIDTRTTGATGRSTGMTDASGNYSLGVTGNQDDELAVVVQSADLLKFASARWYATSAPTYARDLALLARRDYQRGVIPAAKIKVTPL